MKTRSRFSSMVTRSRGNSTSWLSLAVVFFGISVLCLPITASEPPAVSESSADQATTAAAPAASTPIDTRGQKSAKKRSTLDVPISRLVQETEGVRGGNLAAGHGSPLASFLRFLATAVSVIALLVFVLVLYRRWLPGGRSTSVTEGVQVISRVALSPKHFVYVIRCGARSLAVGVSGDRMTTLADLGEVSDGDVDSDADRDVKSSTVGDDTPGAIPARLHKTRSSSNPSGELLRRSRPFAAWALRRQSFEAEESMGGKRG